MWSGRRERSSMNSIDSQKSFDGVVVPAPCSECTTSPSGLANAAETRSSIGVCRVGTPSVEGRGRDSQSISVRECMRARGVQSLCSTERTSELRRTTCRLLGVSRRISKSWLAGWLAARECEESNPGPWRDDPGCCHCTTLSFLAYIKGLGDSFVRPFSLGNACIGQERLTVTPIIAG